MKSILIACASLALVAACSREPSSGTKNPATTESSSYASYASMDRLEFIQTMERELEAIDKQVAALEQKNAAAGAAQTPASRTEVASLRDRRDAIRQKLAGLKTSLDKGTDELRMDIVMSCHQVRDALTKALQGT